MGNYGIVYHRLTKLYPKSPFPISGTKHCGDEKYNSKYVKRQNIEEKKAIFG